jgi:hypothetical protein
MLMGALVGDIDYQRKFQADFRKRRLHPSIEARVWEYAIGRPTEQIALSANVTLKERLAADRDMLRQLDLEQLEALAAESQALVDHAFAAALAKHGNPDRIDVAATRQVASASVLYQDRRRRGGC